MFATYKLQPLVWFPMLLFFASLVGNGSAADLCQLSTCAKISMNDTCPSGTVVKGRCCVVNGTVVYGIDLRHCELSSVPTADLAAYLSLNFLYLDSNPLEQCDVTDFAGQLTLAMLTLPKGRRCEQCPGGEVAWASTSGNASAAQTTCEGEQDFCEVKVQLNVSCPENSRCAPRGPGLAECDCVGDYYGYKCGFLGGFAWPWFGVVWAGATTAATAYFALVGRWFARRNRPHHMPVVSLEHQD